MARADSSAPQLAGLAIALVEVSAKNTALTASDAEERQFNIVETPIQD